MPKWATVEQSEEYQKLPDKQKAFRKGQFFWEHIKDSDKYSSLPKETQDKIFDDFIMNKQYFGAVASDAYTRFKKLPGIRHGDTAIENIARFIEPDSAQPGIAGMAKFFPRQMSADFLIKLNLLIIK